MCKNTVLTHNTVTVLPSKHMLRGLNTYYTFFILLFINGANKNGSNKK